ncbi:uncharacterized protein ARMOST_04263 [Armillaria ostoyae]|uniref:Uncharacterized protein n=1 Tax=Armillaria ostoyae TaxID=47428 RepID=A0A284QWV5_ARMOS|nr:uncharacterized protein ARMOST_04263 [Armillaria ostoyae]
MLTITAPLCGPSIWCSSRTTTLALNLRCQARVIIKAFSRRHSVLSLLGRRIDFKDRGNVQCVRSLCSDSPHIISKGSPKIEEQTLPKLPQVNALRGLYQQQAFSLSRAYFQTRGKKDNVVNSFPIQKRPYLKAGPRSSHF